MARKPSLHVLGGLCHAVLRDNGGQDIFFAEKDRQRFLDLLAEGTALRYAGARLLPDDHPRATGAPE